MAIAWDFDNFSDVDCFRLCRLPLTGKTMRLRNHPNSPAILSISILLMLSCGGDKSVPTVASYDVCGCIPGAPASIDFRRAEKHIPLPASTPAEITVDTVLGWPIDPALLVDGTPRSGRELQMFHMQTA